MQDQAPSTQSPIMPGQARIPRARSVPSARPFRVAVFFSAVYYLGLVAVATALLCFFLEPSRAASEILLGSMFFSAVAWLVALFKRRSTFCPLCKGTPLWNTGARTHARAKRIFPFNHGVSATLSILATQQFRCMYCGSDYDLLKPRTRLLYKDAESRDAGEDEAPGRRS